MGIAPNAANRDGGRRYRNPPSDWEQRRRRAYRYDRYDDDYDLRRYRPAYRYYYRYGTLGKWTRARNASITSSDLFKAGT